MSLRRRGSPAEAHIDRMTDLAPEMAATKFARWTIKGSGGQPSWSEALKRLLEDDNRSPQPWT